MHRDRLELRLSTGVLAAFFAFPQLGRPHFPEAGNGSDPVMVLGPDRVTVKVVGLPSESAELVRAALADRIALVASGDPTTVIPLELGSSTPVDGGVGFPLLGRPAERQLYDVELRAGTVGWEVVAPPAVYYRSTWTDFGLAHITDTHVARRIDSFRPTLRDLGLTEAAARMCNMNDQFRGFVSFANRLHAAGELDVIVATGDLIDYVHETDDDREGLGNAGFLRDLFDDFAACFNDADTVMIAPVYAAGEDAIEGVNSEALVQRIRAGGHRDARYIDGPAAVAPHRLPLLPHPPRRRDRRGLQ